MIRSTLEIGGELTFDYNYMIATVLFYLWGGILWIYTHVEHIVHPVDQLESAMIRSVMTLCGK